MKKKQITISLDEDVIKKMEEVRKITGLPISTQIELKLKGYIVKKEIDE
ncbi:hypothetical protein NEF87_002691 [Candidatus Lokiarchaeum ossiferum]|uniref:Ribbon-helix-helix protein CopG domain-containing protein n=1 Tax=Candidatus Lokiarchaeum ossiferum TaxID=2951803 RepID=A0ABY6HSC0_9ARCH|nr:hypothetical protein NEF87_002691 [Candidatus Lokiarchaeum sp. B-35]